MSIKTRLRNGAARLLYLSGLTAPARRGRGQLSIVTFHRVLPEAERRAIVEREADDQADKVRKAAADRKKLDALIGARAAGILARMKANGF